MFTAIIVIIGLSLLILGHEAGHFFAAKFFKLRVDEFGFGFPPRMFAKKIGETEYSINWLPFGGFVKIAGENDQFDKETGKTLTDEEKARVFYSQPAWRRSIIILAGVFVNFIFAWLLFSFVLMAGTPSFLAITSVLPGSPAASAGIMNNDILKNFRSVAELEKAFEKKNTPVKLEILRETKSIEIPFVPAATTREVRSAIVIEDIQPNSPAEEAKLKKGDVLQSFSETSDFISFVNAHRGEVVTLQVFRKNEIITITPRLRSDINEGGLGILLSEGELFSGEGILVKKGGIEPQGFFSAIADGLGQTFEVAQLTLSGFYELIKGLFTRGKLVEGIVGPIGIFSFAAGAGQVGFSNLIYLLALISANLAMINLIPFPALDGGRFFLILVEKIKGSPISVKTESVINTFGFVFLIFLMIIVAVRDIINL